MRDYGKVFTRFWESDDMRSLSDDGRMLALYLLTCKHGTLAGCFRLPNGYVCEDMQWGSERVSKGFQELSEKGFATRCEVTNWVWIRRYLEQNPLENPNQRKAAVKLILTIPVRCTWGDDFVFWCAETLGVDPNGDEFGNRFERVPKPSPNQEQEQEQDKEHICGSTAVDPPADRADPIPFAEIVAEYNRTLTGLPKVRELTPKRRTLIRTAWQASPKRRNIEFWRSYLAECQDDDFLNGTGPYREPHANWRPDFDYLLSAKCVTKVFERAMDRIERGEP
jgi:hypothetical protein